MQERSRLAHGVSEKSGEPTIVFLTVCTQNRARWLTTAEAQRRLLQVWEASSAWRVGRFVLMPDHLHLFCAPGSTDLPLDNWVRFWKGRFRQVIRRPAWKWQAGHWDTRLRRPENYQATWEYTRRNPVRAGLVAHEDDWPYQGAMQELRW